MTNYEKIKNMSVEEMARRILVSDSNCLEAICEAVGHCPSHEMPCIECTKQWLESEVDDE